MKLLNLLNNMLFDLFLSSSIVQMPHVFLMSFSFMVRILTMDFSAKHESK